MKTQRALMILVAIGLLVGACSPVLAQAEKVKVKAKELKKQVESGSTTNAPKSKPGN
jgi:hypothetical protein